MHVVSIDEPGSLGAISEQWMFSRVVFIRITLQWFPCKDAEVK